MDSFFAGCFVTYYYPIATTTTTPFIYPNTYTHFHISVHVSTYRIHVIPHTSYLIPHTSYLIHAAGTYILPGGQATSRAIAPFEAEAIEEHPYIKAAFGDKYQWEVRLLTTLSELTKLTKLTKFIRTNQSDT
jgi:hypothetical protein